MQTEVVEFDQDGLKARLTVSRATVMIGMKRTRLRAASNGNRTDFEQFVLRGMIYPDLIAATVEASGIPWPLSFEEFVELPEELGIAWEEAVYRLNPHWLPRPAPDTEEGKAEVEEKKA